MASCGLADRCMWWRMSMPGAAVPVAPSIVCVLFLGPTTILNRLVLLAMRWNWRAVPLKMAGRLLALPVAMVPPTRWRVACWNRGEIQRLLFCLWVRRTITPWLLVWFRAGGAGLLRAWCVGVWMWGAPRGLADPDGLLTAWEWGSTDW